MKKILIIAGARPNFMKIAPIIKEIDKHPSKLKYYLVHTGQHYNENMSKSFFEDLEIPKPDINLGISGGSSTEQSARIMLELEKVLKKQNPDLVIVVGDVNSTFASAYAVKQNKIKLAHVEAGLRSRDFNMPEEINRIVTDSLSDYHFISEISGGYNLLKEGIKKSKIFFVGNAMIDSLINNLPKIKTSKALEEYSLVSKRFAVVTIHRPSNVDTKESLENVYDILKNVSLKIKLVWPLHPRMKKRMKEFKLEKKFNSLKNIIFTEPLGYLDFMKLVINSKFVLTDSGGIQEETTYLKIPCITLRGNTERPSTVKQGTNAVTGLNKKKILLFVNMILKNKYKKGVIPKYWDGNTSKRIVSVLLNTL